MKLLVLFSLVTASRAASTGYSSGVPTGPAFSHGGSGLVSGGSGFVSGGSGFASGGSGFSSGGGGFSAGSGFVGGGCGGGQVRHVDGSCVTPQVTRNLYVYRAPDVAPIIGPRPAVPPPRVIHNIVFIRTPEGLVSQQPVVVPPPQQKNIVYVLNKRQRQEHQLIHVPAPEQKSPEVYFVNYGEGENPSLPTGGDLHSALHSAAQGNGGLIGHGDGIGIGHGGGIGGNFVGLDGSDHLDGGVSGGLSGSYGVP